MNRGSWLLALGLSSVVGAFLAPGCSSSSDNGGGSSSGTDSGTHDGTASSSGADSSSSSGGDTGAHETGSSSGSDGSSDSGGDGPSCPAAAVLPAQLQACVSQFCCTQWTTCAGDASCLAVAQCVGGCVAADGGDANTCATKCAADASATGASDFNSFGICVATSCSGGPTDGGGGEGGEGGGGGDGGGDGAPKDSGGGG